MVFSPDDFQPIPSPRSSARARERGLRRSRRLTRWVAVTAVAGAAALGGFYTHLLPGGSAAPAPTGPAPVQSPATPSSATAAGGAGQHDDGGEQGDDEDEDRGGGGGEGGGGGLRQTSVGSHAGRGRGCSGEHAISVGSLHLFVSTAGI